MTDAPSPRLARRPRSVGIAGAGVVGSAVGRALAGSGAEISWFDVERGAAASAARRLSGTAAGSLATLAGCDVVVLATPGPHLPVVTDLLDRGCPAVVSMSDVPDDVEALTRVRARDAALVVGAAMAPGLSGLIARHLAGQLEIVDEIHVAMHGTGGPACARQHHDALRTKAIGWHDGQWIERPGGSGRELAWFPGPVGAVDCYRAGVPDPWLLHRAFPGVQRISARVSATRRDRLTARLPMLAPPRRGGDEGAVRVEARGSIAGGARETHIAGALGRVGDIAGAVAAGYVAATLSSALEPGVHVAGADPALSAWVLARVAAAGVELHEFNGIASTGHLV